MEYNDPPKRARFTDVLINGPFLLLWVGQLLSQLADRIFIYVLIIVAYSITHRNLGVAVPMLSFGIPAVLFGSIAGVYADRWSRKNILVASNLLRGILILLVLIPGVNNSLLLLFAVSFLIYSVAQFFAPAETAAIPDLVAKKDLIIANSLFMVTWMASSVIGLGLGAPLTILLGEEKTLQISSVLYFIAAAAVFFLPLKKSRGELTDARLSVMGELRMGLEFIRRSLVVAYALFKMFLVTSLLAIVSMLAISFAKEILQIGAKSFGYLIFSAGIGMFAGMIFLGRVSHRVPKGSVVIAGFLLSGIILIALASVTSIVMVLGLVFFLGFGNALITVTIQTILQENIPRPIRGRIFGVQNMLINSAFTLPVVFFGGMADLFGLRTVFYSLGIITILTGFASIFIPKFRTV